MLSKKIYLLKFLAMLLCCAVGGGCLAQRDVYQFDALTIQNGLSNNQVTAIVKDEKGFLWYGTHSGLNRYDGYSFKIFKHRIGDSTSINDDYVTRVVAGPANTLWVRTPNGWNIYDPRTETFSAGVAAISKAIGTSNESFSDMVKDKSGQFWFLYTGQGIGRYSPDTKKFVLFNSVAPGGLYSNNVVSIAADNAGAIWVAYAQGVLDKFNAAGALLLRTTTLQAFSTQFDTGYQLFADADNDIWVVTRGGAKGLFLYQQGRNTAMQINTESAGWRLNNNVVNTITQDDKGLIWAGTDHGGINLLDKKTATVRYLTTDESDPKSLSQNSITSVYKDAAGIVWIGTYKKGLNRFHESNLRFPLYQHQPGVAGSLAYNDVNKFVEDDLGNLWIGTNGGGLIYFNRSTGTFKQYLHNAANPNSLTNNVIVSLCLDHEKKLWIGTYYGGMDCFDGKTFTHYRHNDAEPGSLADDRVWEIFEDSQQQLWVGTLSEGLERFNRGTKTFQHYKPGSGNNTIHSGYVCSIVEDRQGALWLGTSAGVDVLDRQSGLFRHYPHIDGDTASLSNNNVIEIMQDSRSLIWVATRDGLNLYDPVKKGFRIFRTKDGLPDNSVLTLVEDNNHNLWATTPNGLCNIFVTASAAGPLLQFKTYDERDGLQGRQFNENAALKTRNGEVVVGGANGFNVFLPSKIRQSRVMPKIILTDLQIFNNPVKVGEPYSGAVVLKEAIAEAKEINLKYNQNVFTIEFAALGFLASDKIKYAYKLQGFNNDWLETDARNRKATFTNLNPGTYTLLVKASNEDGVWGDTPLSLTIHILPPFWLTPYAFLLYVLVLLAALAVARHFILRRAQARFNLERERQEASRLHELDMMKIKFFTNISHEFRTPLSLIISPAERMLAASKEPESKKQLQFIYRNARRLLNLVNQLLDFRKLEEQELKLTKTAGDLVEFAREISYSFSDLAENKKIAFSFHSAEEMLLTAFDHDKVERILFNLLSNAFKFTPVGGAVKVLLETRREDGELTVVLRVIDTGIGIGKDKQEKIFERFFQNDVPGTMVNQGSGIGLAITKEFVRMHGGLIWVESEPDKGSTFIIELPVTPVIFEKEIAPPAEVAPFAEALSPLPEVQKPVEERPSGGKKKTILLVEDNDDFRFYIKDNLKSQYTILEAPNGKAGWQRTLADHPDLIVCDISMPEMTGIELCRKIKGDSRTAFIPVILLTALTGEDDQLTGLKTGANDYMTKPFNFEILLSKIRNLILQQEGYKKTYQKQVQVKPSEVVGESAEDKFIQQTLTVIEKNISNPDFSVEELSRELFMSRVALYKKLFGLTGKTPIEFIRSIRLQRAAQLLQKKGLTVAEVAYEVGFNNPKYFSKYFKQEYNVLPSVYAGNGETE